MEESLILRKSMDFAVRTVKLCRFLSGEKRENVLSRQLLRSGTAIGANLREAEFAQSTNDFISKNSIALKEASESRYWLELLYKTGYLTEKQFQSIFDDCTELIRILVAIIKTAKERRDPQA